jgi:hypothetical protein
MPVGEIIYVNEACFAACKKKISADDSNEKDK